MKLINEKLASVACMKKIISSTDGDKKFQINIADDAAELDSLHVKDSNNVSHHQSKMTSSVSAAATRAGACSNSVECLLASIHDLLETKLRSDAQLRHQTDKNQQLMNQWIIAAAVIDRISFIILAVVLVTGTAVFAFQLLSRPWVISRTRTSETTLVIQKYRQFGSVRWQP